MVPLISRGRGLGGHGEDRPHSPRGRMVVNGGGPAPGTVVPLCPCAWCPLTPRAASMSCAAENPVVWAEGALPSGHRPLRRLASHTSSALRASGPGHTALTQPGAAPSATGLGRHGGTEATRGAVGEKWGGRRACRGRAQGPPARLGGCRVCRGACPMIVSVGGSELTAP